MSDERGFTLVETLVSTMLLLIVLGATLTTLDGFNSRNRDANERADAVERARSQVDRLARELRNLASPTFQSPDAIDRLEDFDIIFQSVDPTGPAAALNGANVRRVRYCLNTGDPERGVMWFMTQRWDDAPPAAPGTGVCNGSAPGWDEHVAIAGQIVNAAQGAPVFSFDATEPSEVRQLRIDLRIDTDPGRGTRPTDLRTGVYLRNQNGVPVAQFSVTRAGGRRLILNGSASTDPENEPLDYVWRDNGVVVGEGVTATYDVPGTGFSTRSITLTVYDPAQLEGSAPAQEVSVP